MTKKEVKTQELVAALRREKRSLERQLNLMKQELTIQEKRFKGLQRGLARHFAAAGG